MSKEVPDGEYELDMSGLFSGLQTDVFGLRYGFLPNTVDNSYRSMMYRESSNAEIEVGSSNDFESCYLFMETKANEKAITTTHKEDDRMYFEGRYKKPTLNNTISASNNYNEFLLSFDEISRTFKIDGFDGFIKINKSRDSESVINKISKLEHTYKHRARNTINDKKPEDLKIVDYLLGSILNSKNNNNSTPNTKINKIPQLPNNLNNYESVLNKLSPIRKSKVAQSSASPSPMVNKLQKHVFLSKPNSPLTSNHPKSPVNYTPKITQTTQSAPTTPKIANSPHHNGGMGARKQQKSLLLRKAERAVGINNNGRIYKPKTKEASPIKSKTYIDDVPKPRPEAHKNMIREREVKEARPDQASFELFIAPPTQPSQKTVVEKINQSLPKKEKIISKIIKKASREQLLTNKPKPVVQKEQIMSDEDLENFAEELESELEAANDKRDELDDGDRTVKFPPKKSTTSGEANEALVSNGEILKKNKEEEEELEFSDWDDTDAVDNFVVEETNDSDFQLIIEDDPLKSKRENEKEMQARREKEREETIEFEKQLRQKQKELEKQQEIQKKSNTKTVVKTTKKSTKQNVDNGKIKEHSTEKEKSNTKTVETNDTEIDEELDKVFDDVFDDIEDEEDMSEEE